MVNRLVSVGDDFTLPAAVKAADANLPERLGETALNATYATTGALAAKADASTVTGKLDKTEAATTYIKGKGGKKLVTVSGVIRNQGSALGYWQPIIDSDHQGDLNIESVATTASQIQLNYPSLGATKVVSFVATPDDTLAMAGFTVGTSVSLGQTRLMMGQTAPEWSVYVYYNGTSWVSNGNWTVTFNAGTLTMTHPAIPSWSIYALSVAPRGGPYMVQAANESNFLSTTTVKLEFRDFAGTLITTPDVNMRAVVRHGGGFAAVPDHRLVDTTAYPGSNIWFTGVFETA